MHYLKTFVLICGTLSTFLNFQAPLLAQSSDYLLGAPPTNADQMVSQLPNHLFDEQMKNPWAHFSGSVHSASFGEMPTLYAVSNRSGSTVLDSLHYKLWKDGQWQTSEKNFYQNDCNALRPISQLTQVYDADTKKFKDTKRTEYAYHPVPGNIISEQTGYGWDETTRIWKNTSHSLHNQDRLVTESWSKTWSSSDQKYTSGSRFLRPDKGCGHEYYYHDFDVATQDWTSPSSTVLLECNAQGLVSKETTQWLGAQGTLEPRQIIQNEYNAAGKITDVYIDFYAAGVLDVQNHARYYYGANNLLDSILTFAKIPSISLWVLGKRQTFSYDSQQRQTEYMEEVVTQGTWTKRRQILLTYHPDGKLHTRIVNIWGEKAEKWVEEERHAFNEHGVNVLQSIRFGFDQATEIWLYGYQISNEYTGSIWNGFTVASWNPANGLWENTTKGTVLRDSEQEITMQTNYIWNTVTSTWDENEQYQHFRGTCVVAAKEPKRPALDCVFPNPFAPGQSIRCFGSQTPGVPVRFQLFDITGRLVHQRTLAQDTAEPLSVDLADGLYHIVVTDDRGGAYKGKVMAAQR